MKLKILSVDFTFNIDKVENAHFESKVSFADYDVVIINPRNIPTKWFDRSEKRKDGTYTLYSGYDEGLIREILELMERRAEETRLIVEKNHGIVVCFLIEPGMALDWVGYNEKLKSSVTHKIKRYDWLSAIQPFKKGFDRYFKKRYGKEIGKIHQGHPFSDFISNLKDYIRYEVVLNDQIFSDFTDAERYVRPIATNRASELIAFEVSSADGKLIFLPPILIEADPQKVAGTLFNCIKEVMNNPDLGPAPDWLGNYRLPGEDELEKQLREIQEEEEKIKNKKKEINEHRYNLDLLKGLLYGKGKITLEPAVRKAFKIIGFNVLDPDSYEEEYDLYAEEGDLLIIGEIEGSDNQIDVKKYRQLLDYVDKAVQNGKKCKGLLIGNGCLDKEPNSRGEQFTKEVINGCRTHGFCRITTFELFKAINKILGTPNNNETKERIKRSIIECKYEFLFDQLDI
ncbi:MAG: hypothetical protein QMD88_06970 [Coprothermobacterota bacterium]|nr:hypothetical protein [Coprothermobacterota bacterium]